MKQKWFLEDEWTLNCPQGEDGNHDPKWHLRLQRPCSPMITPNFECFYKWTYDRLIFLDRMHKNRLFHAKKWHKMSQSVSRCHFSRFSEGFDLATYNFAFISVINQQFRNNLVIFQFHNDIFGHIIIYFEIVNICIFWFFQVSNKVLWFLSWARLYLSISHFDNGSLNSQL